MSRLRANTMAPGLANLTDSLQESFVEKDYVATVRACILAVAGASKDLSVEPATARELFDLAFEAVLTHDLPAAAQQTIDATPALAPVFLGFVYLVSSAARARVTDRALLEDLRRVCLPAPLVEAFTKAFAARRAELEAAAAARRITLPGLARFDWRTDVAITTTHLVKAFKPSVTVQLATTAGDVHTFECNVERFHQLRFAVARVLAAMHNIEQSLSQFD